MAEEIVRLLRRSERVLRSGSTTQKIAFLHELGRFDDPRSIPVFLKAAGDADAAVRAVAVGKLVFINSPAIIPDLVRMLDDGEPRVRQHALYALQRLKARKAAAHIARVMLKDPDGMTRFNAALALSVVGTKEHKDAFVRALKDASLSVRYTALKALAEWSPDEAASHILRMVRDTESWEKVPEGSRDVILRLLEKRLNRRDVIALLRRMVGDAVSRAGSGGYSMDVVEAARLLAVAGDRTGVPVLVRCLRGSDYSQELGLRALAMLKERSAVPAILAGPFRNGFYTIKLKAIQALGEIGDPRALPSLAGLFDDCPDDFPVDRTQVITKDDPELRLRALEAMAKIAARRIREAAQSADPFQRRMAKKVASVRVS